MTAQQQAVSRSLESISNDLGITDTSTAARVYEASLGAGTAKAIRLAAGVALRNSSDEQIMDTVRKVQQVSRDAGLTNEKAVVHAAMAGGGFEMGGQGGRRGARELRASHDTATAYERQAQSSFSDAQALRNAASAVTRDGFAITADDTFAIHQRAAQEGVSRSAMNDPVVMMDVARRHFVAKYGAAVGTPLANLDPHGAPPSASHLTEARFSTGAVASPARVRDEASSAQAEISAVSRREGVQEDGAPAMHDVAKHFVDTKQAVQAVIAEQERGVSEDGQALQGERTRRFDRKSIFNDANPGGKSEPEPPLTTQREFYTGGEDPPHHDR